MAEFCLNCWNKINDINLSEKDVIISKDLDLCEGCAELKPVIIRYKRIYLFKEYLNDIKNRNKKI